jgi:hypothetical protein
MATRRRIVVNSNEKAAPGERAGLKTFDIDFGKARLAIAVDQPVQRDGRNDEPPRPNARRASPALRMPPRQSLRMQWSDWDCRG